MHTTQLYLPQDIAGLLTALGRFRDWYMPSRRGMILREEYGYVMRAILRRKTA